MKFLNAFLNRWSPWRLQAQLNACGEGLKILAQQGIRADRNPTRKIPNLSSIPEEHWGTIQKMMSEDSLFWASYLERISEAIQNEAKWTIRHANELGG